MIDGLLHRIGLSTMPACDAEGLRTLHRAFLEHVPYEDIAVQLGEWGPLDEAALAARMCADGRGGYCFELNTVFAALLRACGFEVTHHEADVGGQGTINHMALLVVVGDAWWLADGGLGEGFLEPLPLVEGVHRVGPFEYTLTREDGGSWWLGQHAWGSFSGFRMDARPAPLSAFEAHHARQASDPASSFVRVFLAQRPRPDRIVTLRSRTLSSIGPAVDDKHVVADVDEFANVLAEVFGIVVTGERLERLWAKACAQHETYLAARA